MVDITTDGMVTGTVFCPIQAHGKSTVIDIML